ncbi:hypothetical protein BS50DRAFT_660142 [Corynespora cassiicola Philippines]|uniref:Uncharacterized protein n=1 Tax=Corynespora cassiicola Philippines TaxID=1448308 RepID=A0A2T2P0E4_CORCC|nr:hypothetical protein BS50DRAFT_660142 [Corynespora cassiicola Philippines]
MGGCTWAAAPFDDDDHHHHHADGDFVGVEGLAKLNIALCVPAVPVVRGAGCWLLFRRTRGSLVPCRGLAGPWSVLDEERRWTGAVGGTLSWWPCASITSPSNPFQSIWSRTLGILSRRTLKEIRHGQPACSTSSLGRLVAGRRPTWSSSSSSSNNSRQRHCGVKRRDETSHGGEQQGGWAGGRGRNGSRRGRVGVLATAPGCISHSTSPHGGGACPDSLDLGRGAARPLLSRGPYSQSSSGLRRPAAAEREKTREGLVRADTGGHCRTAAEGEVTMPWHGVSAGAGAGAGGGGIASADCNPQWPCKARGGDVDEAVAVGVDCCPKWQATITQQRRALCSPWTA